MYKALKYARWGFLFGAIGLYALAALSLISPILEKMAAPFLYPGRWLSLLVAGTDGSVVEVILLTLFNGILYAAIFVLVAIIAKKTTGA